MTQINWQYQVNNRAGGYIVQASDWNDYASCFRAFIDQTTSSTTDNSPLPIGIDLANDRVYISDPDSTTPEDANHADTTLSVVGSSTFNGTMDLTSAVIQGASPLVFEGSSDNAHETTFAITDPTADRTITFKDGTGTVAFTSDITTTNPAGSDHQVQFNDGGSFGADANFTYDGSATTLKATLTVGQDDTGHDVKFFGATSGKYMEWDESADQLDVTGSFDVTGDSTMTGLLTIGVDGTGHDVLFYGDTAGSYWFWDTSLNKMDVSQQETSATLTDFTQAISKASINLVGDYTDGHYQGMIVWTTDDDNSGKPKAGMWIETESGGSTMYWGVSENYATGITETMRLLADGTLRVMSDASILQLWDINNSGQSGYVGYYDSGGTRLGYVGYPANDDLYFKNEDSDGNIYFAQEGSGSMYWYLNGNGEMKLTTARLQPYSDKGLSLGDASNRWNVLYVNEIEADAGSASDPSYTFNGDEDTGMYSTTNVLRFSTGGSLRALMASSGFYAIKAVSTGTYALWASSGYLVAFSSSQRYKENISALPRSEWEKIYTLEAKQFDWKEDGTVEIDPNRGKHDHGFIAEEVEKILPKVVNYDAVDHEDTSKGYQVQSVNYGELTPYLVEAIKDLKTRIETLEG